MNITPIYIVTGSLPNHGCIVIYASTDYEEAKERYRVAIKDGYYDDECTEILLHLLEGDSSRLLLEHQFKPTNQPY